MPAIMRIRISHATDYRYDTPPTGVIQMLRLTPRNHDGQYVVDWRIDCPTDCRLHQHEDAFGNITHVFTADGPFPNCASMVEGEVETHDTNGVVQRRGRALSAGLFLRETALTQPDAALAAYAARSERPDGGTARRCCTAC